MGPGHLIQHLNQALSSFPISFLLKQGQGASMSMSVSDSSSDSLEEINSNKQKCAQETHFKVIIYQPVPQRYWQRGFFYLVLAIQFLNTQEYLLSL